jgi:hypothetical protein
MVPYTHIVSLGTNCLTSMFLKCAGLKRYSAPFDWVNTEGLDRLESMLDDDFASFLDPDQLTAHADVAVGKAGHRLYGLAFFHHFDPRQRDGAAYYKRCVERFRALADVPHGEGVLFVLSHVCTLPADQHAQLGYDDLPRLQRLRDRLRAVRGAGAMTLLVVRHTACAARFQPTFALAHSERDLLVADAQLVAGHNGVSFLHADDGNALLAFLRAQVDLSRFRALDEDRPTERAIVCDLGL